jgi:hypothetical protein
MDWEEGGKLRSCPLLISVVCLLAPGRTWGNPRQPTVSVIGICGENGTKKFLTLTVLIVNTETLAVFVLPSRFLQF